MKKLFTIGHSTRSIGDFTDLLMENQVKVLADVRLFPGSRRYPQFNGEELERHLTGWNIRYLHFPALGGRRKARPDSKNIFWENEAFRGYADYMETPEFQKAVTSLAGMAEKENIAVMCAEAVWWRCHRRLIADWFVLKGWQVRHIMGKGNVTLHKASEAARFIQGGLFYS